MSCGPVLIFLGQTGKLIPAGFDLLKVEYLILDTVKNLNAQKKVR